MVIEQISLGVGVSVNVGFLLKSATCPILLLKQLVRVLLTNTLYELGALVGPPRLIAFTWLALLPATVIGTAGATADHKYEYESAPALDKEADAVPSGVIPTPVVQLFEPVVAI